MILGIIGATQGGTSAVAAVVKELGLPLEGLARCLDDAELFGPVDFPEEVVARRNGQYGNWAWKYPIAYLPSEYPILAHTDKLIIVWRDPLARSIHKRDFNAPNMTVFNEWFELAKTWRKIPLPHLHISYEKLLVRPEESVRTIADFIGLPYKQSAVMKIDPDKGYDAN